METLGKSHDACLQDIRNRISSEMVLLENKSKEVLYLSEELLKSGDRKLLSAECLNARRDLRDATEELSSPLIRLIFIFQEGICPCQTKTEMCTGLTIAW